MRGLPTGAQPLDFLRRYLPFHHGVTGGRWLTLLMNRIDPGLFAAAFSARVREIWPDKPYFVALDGRTSRRSHDKSAGKAPLHLVSAFACRVLGQHRSTQRKVAKPRADEAALTAAIVALADQYGYRRITALLRTSGWVVNAERVERIWRQEGLKVPAKQPKKGRL